MQVVFEAPPGLKQNIQRTYAFWSSDFLAGHVASATARRSSSGDEQPGARRIPPTMPAGLVPLRAQMLFMLAWFNAVLQERQNYVPIVSEVVRPLQRPDLS
jgi:dynein heavy chain 2